MNPPQNFNFPPYINKNFICSPFVLTQGYESMFGQSIQVITELFKLYIPDNLDDLKEKSN
jgi:hypothetical protein